MARYEISDELEKIRDFFLNVNYGYFLVRVKYKGTNATYPSHEAIKRILSAFSGIRVPKDMTLQSYNYGKFRLERKLSFSCVAMDQYTLLCYKSQIWEIVEPKSQFK